MNGRPAAGAGWLLVVAGLLAAPRSPAAQALTAELLFRSPSIREVSISPSGQLLAAVASAAKEHFVLVRGTERGRPQVAFQRRREIVDLSWVDGDDLVVTLLGERGPGGARVPEFHRIHVAGSGADLSTEEAPIESAGWLADPLPNAEDDVLWARSDDDRSEVYRVPLSELLEEYGPPDPRYRVAAMKGFVPRWIADRSGVVRAALRVDDESPPSAELLYRASADESWRSLFRSTDPDEGRRPVGMASNGRDLLVLSNEGRETWALYELDVETRELGRELFAHPDFDVVAVKYDYSGSEIIGAVYLEAGLPSYHYFDAFASRYQRSLEQVLPDQAVSITSASADGRYLALRAWSPRDPGTYYVLDTTTRQAQQVGRQIEGIDASRLADVEAFEVEAPDGRRIGAFLTRPRHPGGTLPLVVWPHGGPIGVADLRHFDPWVQFLADAGIAVLQVNYRGSEGYGKSFLAAGRRAWAEGIEDDIEAAVDHAAARGWIDPRRVCIAGWSYGGYSALISAIRSPERYRCAASLAGPTDVPLLFQSSDFAASEEGRRRLAEIVGDPESERARLIEISPVYRAKEIRVPVLLGHGSEDRRVDVEHLHRMHLVLSELGKPHEWFVIDGAEHSPTPDQSVEFAQRLRAFLVGNLGAGWSGGPTLPPAPARASPRRRGRPRGVRSR